MTTSVVQCLFHHLFPPSLSPVISSLTIQTLHQYVLYLSTNNQWLLFRCGRSIALSQFASTRYRHIDLCKCINRPIIHTSGEARTIIHHLSTSQASARSIGSILDWPVDFATCSRWFSPLLTTIQYFKCLSWKHIYLNILISIIYWLVYHLNFIHAQLL